MEIEPLLVVNEITFSFDNFEAKLLGEIPQ